MSQTHYNIAIVGAGPGGFAAALHAAQLGLRVALVEADKLGGECLHRGCIPSKAILKSAEVFDLVHRAAEFGVTVTGVEMDVSRVMAAKREAVEQLYTGLQSVVERADVELIAGRAQLTDPHTLVVDADGQTQTLTAEHVILATGSRPRDLLQLPVDGQRIITSWHALELQEPPPSLAIVGGGAVGVEMATAYQALGSQVTVIEMLSTLLPGEDAQIGQLLAREFTKRGIQVLTGTRVSKAEVEDDTVRLQLKGGEVDTLDADTVLVAVGRVGNTQGLGLETVGIDIDHGFIAVDAVGRTRVDNMFAIGDVAGGFMLAHKAAAEGRVVVEVIAGRDPHPLNPLHVPRCTFSHPEVAGVGWTEAQARDDREAVAASKRFFAANGKAVCERDSIGFVKLIADGETGELLGAGMIGPKVTELIAEVATLMHTKGTVEQLASSIHAHPTLAESIGEGAEPLLAALAGVKTS